MFIDKISKNRSVLVSTLLASLAILFATWTDRFSAGAQSNQISFGTIPLGTYVSTIAQLGTNPYYMMDEVKVSFLAEGKFTLGHNAWVNAVGTYTVTENRVEFTLPYGAAECATKGVYEWSMAGNKLTLTLAPGQSDDCRKRRFFQIAQTFFKVDPAESHWKTIGPTGGTIQSLLIHDGKIFVGTRDIYMGQQFGLAAGGGIFVSKDNGQSWKSTTGMRGYRVLAMAAFNGVLYASATGHGSWICISLDGGETWEYSNNTNDFGLSTAAVSSFAVSNGRLYATASNQGVLRLSDNPYVWEKLGTTGLTNLALTSITAHGGNLFVSTDGDGVFTSADGDNWTPVNTGLTHSRIYTLASDGARLYAGTVYGTTANPNEVFVTNDNGQNWTRVGSGLAPSLPAGLINEIYQLIPSGGKLYAASSTGVIVNEGSNWRSLLQSAPLTQVPSLAIKDNMMFAGGVIDGIGRSLDGGVTWSYANNGLTARTTYAVFKENNVIYTGGYSGVFVSLNNGQSWTRPGLVGFAIQNFMAYDGKVWAGTGNGVFVTANQGQTWTRVSTGLGAGAVTRIVALNNQLYAAVFGAGVFRSDNGGQSWTAVNTDLASLNVADLLARGNHLFAATNDKGVFRAVEGQSWSAVNNGFPATGVISLVASGNTLLASVWGQGIYRSTDNGDTWTKSEIGFSPPGIWTLYASGANVYASGELNVGALRSTDGGQSWTPINTGFDPRYAYGFFADGPTLYAATIFGVCHSQNLVNQQATVSAANYSPTAIVEKSIVAAFGTALATSTVPAATVPWPTELAGTTVKVRDSLGVERLAPLFFVSELQVNYQIPAGTAQGLANVTIINGNGIGATGTFNVTHTAPTVFTLNAQGSGAAVALDAIRYNGTPFDAKQANGEPNIIAVFGTGLGADVTDGGGNLNAEVTARIDGNPATLHYAGPAPGLVGVNQFNVVLPANITSGTHTLTFTRGGVTSNTTTLAIR
jgi:uncharacterized protein (TIGR03437 family)